MASALSSILIGGALLLLVFSGTAMETERQNTAPAVTLANGGMFQNLERPPVVVDHDRHTAALKPLGEDCGACHHFLDEATRGLTWEEGTEQACSECHGENRPRGGPNLMDAFHDTCVACHTTFRAEGLTAGPVTCGRCHVKGTPNLPMPAPAGFEHALHMTVMEEGCDLCHHVYDEETNATRYVKGPEGNCRACHVRTPGEALPGLVIAAPAGVEVRSAKRAVHNLCLTCHRDRAAKGVKAGPVSCLGCHGREAAPLVTPTSPRFPAMARKDPEQVAILSPRSIMPAVPFPHKTHREKVDNCKACHHLHLGPVMRYDANYPRAQGVCDQCHQVTEAPALLGGMTPDELYHDEAVPSSCIGCHVSRGAECKGPREPAPCTACHKGGIEEEGAEAARRPLTLDDDPLEFYIIDRMSKKYEAVYFPHEAHSQLIADCTVCHHYSPDDKGVRCDACHKPVLIDPENPRKPGIVGAYHQMCMGCHMSMGLGPMGCTKCHLEKAVTEIGRQNK